MNIELKKAIHQIAKALYALLKETIKKTSLFTRFVQSGDVIRYDGGRFVLTSVNYSYSRSGMIKNYMDSAVNRLPLLEQYNLDRSRLVSSGATEVVMEGFKFVENAYTYYSPSLNDMCELEANDASDSAQRKQVNNIEQFFYKQEEFFDFAVEIEDSQREEGKVFTKAKIREKFRSYRFRKFCLATLRQFRKLGVTFISLSAKMLQIPTVVAIAWAVNSSVMILIVGIFYSKENDEQIKSVTGGLQPDRPEELLRSVEACIRIKRRSIFICEDTKKEILEDEKLLRKLRQLCVIQGAMKGGKQQTPRFFAEILTTSLYPEYKGKEELFLPLVQVLIENKDQKTFDLIKNIDLNNLAMETADNLAQKYTTWELIKKEFKSLFRFIVQDFLPNIVLLVVFSMVTLVFPASMYTAYYLTMLMIPLNLAIIKPLENAFEEFVCNRLYVMFRQNIFLPIIQFFVTEKTLHQYDCDTKTKLEKGCLDLVRIADTPTVLPKMEIDGVDLQSSVVKDTRYYAAPAA